MTARILMGQLLERVRARHGLIGDMCVYSGIRIMQNCLSLLLVPVYINALPQREFGALDILLSLNAFVILAFMFQAESAVYRFYYAHERSQTLSDFISTHLIAVGCALGGGAALMLTAAPALAPFLLPSIDRPLMLLGVLSAALIPRSWITLLLIVMQLQKRQREYAIGVVLDTMGAGLAVIACVVWLRLGVHGVLLGQLLGTYITFTYIACRNRQYIALRLSRRILRESLHYCLPLMPGMLFGWAQVYASRFIMRYYSIPLEELATYALAFKFLAIINLTIYAVNMAWQPRAMELIGSPRSRPFYARSYQLFTVGLLVIGCLCTVGVRPVVSLIAPAAYASAVMFVPAMIAGSIISSATMCMMGMIVTNRTIWNSVATVVGFGVYCAVCILGIDRYGVWAVVMGGVLGSVTSSAITYAISQRLFYVPSGLRTSVGLLLGTGCLCLVPVLDAHGFVISASIGVICLELLVCAGVLDCEDRTRVMACLGAWTIEGHPQPGK